MRQTLFYVPHELGPLLMFGPVSWGMVGVALYVAICIFWLRGNSTWLKFIQDNAMGWLIGAGIVGFLLPMIETRVADGSPNGLIVGLPVRGYGVMLMLGVLCAIGIAIKRMERVGVNKDAFFSLTLWSVLGGLFGARLFYVIQKWPELTGKTFSEKLWTSLQFTEGGLVVYGGAIGGLITMGYWSWKNRVRPIPLMDAVIPAFFIGLCLGRIGCLMNGCCYGGICSESMPSIRFPVGSPAYMDQLASGRLLGIHTKSENDRTNYPQVESVDAGSWADQKQIHADQTLTLIETSPVYIEKKFNPLDPPNLEARVIVDHTRYVVSPAQLPTASLPVHPAQIYASISALLLCLWTLAIPGWNRRPGLVLGAGLVGYGILRIIEEIIRVDEAGQFGTSLSISQWISVGGILLGIIILVRVVSRPPDHRPDPTSSSATVSV